MTLEQFSRGDSVLHELDCRAKLVSATVLVVVLALSQNFYTAASGLILGLILVGVARLGFRDVLLRLLLVNGFVAFLWITLPLTYPGSPIASIGPVSLSSEGVLLAALITLKANTIVLLLIALVSTSSVADIGHGLDRLGLPSKLCLLLLFSYRYIFVISEEYHRLVRAAKLRGFRPSTNQHTLRTTGYLFGMTLMKSWHRAERVRQAMLLRGFSGKFPTLHDTCLGKEDFGFLLLSGWAAICLLVIEFYLARLL